MRKWGVEQFDTTIAPYVSVLISVDAATAENGCLVVASGWPVDRTDILPMEHPSRDAPDFSKLAQVEEDRIDWARIETQPGDAIFFTERLPHRSSANHSSKSRRILYGVYNPLAESDKRKDYYEDKRSNMAELAGREVRLVFAM